MYACICICNKPNHWIDRPACILSRVYAPKVFLMAGCSLLTSLSWVFLLVLILALRFSPASILFISIFCSSTKTKLLKLQVYLEILIKPLQGCTTTYLSASGPWGLLRLAAGMCRCFNSKFNSKWFGEPLLINIRLSPASELKINTFWRTGTQSPRAVLLLGFQRNTDPSQLTPYWPPAYPAADLRTVFPTDALTGLQFSLSYSHSFLLTPYWPPLVK